VKGLEAHWYRPGPLPVLLLPLSALYCLVVLARRAAYRVGLLPRFRLPVPVIIVGNITVGGTGKTPLVIWVTGFLKARGYRPGIVSRGYGGRASSWPQQVRADSDPYVVGDEAVLLARRCDCPMAVGPDRVSAARALLEYSDCDILVSDDGLQHYPLERDIEIAVVDGVRRFGNGHCLPAGPLREPRRRLEEVDLVVSNGPGGRLEYPMRIRPGVPRRLDDPGQSQPLEVFHGVTVHAVAGIGHPERFFDVLRRAGLQVQAHPFPDHHRFSAGDLDFGDGAPVFMTEKDAVKCQRFAAGHHWYLPVDAEPDERFAARLGALVDARRGNSPADAEAAGR